MKLFRFTPNATPAQMLCPAYVHVWHPRGLPWTLGWRMKVRLPKYRLSIYAAAGLGRDQCRLYWVWD